MIYRYKTTIPQIKNFVRVYEVRASSTLYAFHLFLQNDLSFSPDQQVSFRTYKEADHQVRVCGLFDTGYGAMDQVVLEMLHEKGEDILHYVFDVFKGRYLILQFDGCEDELFRKAYPRTIMERGGSPDQFREDQISFEMHLEELESDSVEDNSGE